MTQLGLAALGVLLAVAGVGVLLSSPARYRKLQKKLDRPWYVERYIYRHHLAFGAGVVVGAMVLLAVLTRYHGTDIDSLGWPTSRGQQLMLLARGVMWLFAVLAWVIGMIVLIRPSVLKGIERKTNRWVEHPTSSLLSPRVFGILLLGVGIVCLLLARL